MVEVSKGGIDYVNPDALVGKYPGEFEQFESPLEAIKTAIAICEAWRKDGRKEAQVAIGSTGGMTLPFEPTTFEDMLALGEKLEAEYRKEELEKADLASLEDF